jgi:hypothetical protein
MSEDELKAIDERAKAATPADQWGQKWDGTLGRGEIRIGPQWGAAAARFMFTAHGFGNAGTTHPDFVLAISAASDVPALVAEVRRLRGLVKDAECDGAEPYAARYCCPWCGKGSGSAQHAPECPAFHENGEVR